MTEQKLREYFESNLDTGQLSLDLKGSQKKTGYDTKAVYIDTQKVGKFEIKKEHLIKLSDDTIAGKLEPADLNTIGFALMTSDFFHWDSETQEGEIMLRVISEWDNPEIGFDINIKNIRLWRHYLLTGEYKLDKNELKQKFRSKGKYYGLYQSIDEILWNDWDPLGINDLAPRDEYQGYTPTILNLRIKGADQETIANKLNEIATTQMDAPSDLDHCRKIAGIIVNIECP
jgi:hypothetical protein